MHCRIALARLLGCVWAASVGLGGCTRFSPDHEVRGDQYLLAGRLDDALAEYRVALRQDPENPELLVKLIEGYFRRDEVAWPYVSRLVALGPERAGPVLEALLDRARRKRERGAKSEALETVRRLAQIVPGFDLGELALDLAESLKESGDQRDAVRYYLMGMTDGSSGWPREWAALQLGEVYEGLEEPFRALRFYRLAMQGGTREMRSTARWGAGRVAYQLAESGWKAGDAGSALGYIEEVLAFGQPPFLMDEAWFLRGEILAEQGQTREALTAFEQVLSLNPSGQGRIVEEARSWIRDLRFRERRP